MNNRTSIRHKWKSDNEMFYYIGLEKKILPMILGAAVGDALGVPVEFKTRGSYEVSDMIGYGTHYQPKGTWSDDTSLTMCLIEAIIKNETEDDILKKFGDYLKNGYWTPKGEAFDIGIATQQAIERHQKGIPAKACGGKNENDNGNGALMRISPLVPMLSQTFDFDKKINKIKKICEITHAHPRSTLACIIYIQFMIMLYNNNEKVIAYEETVDLINKYVKKDEYFVEFPYFDRILTNRIYNYDKEAIQSDGYVVHTLEASMWCFFKHDNYKDIILEAVNLGGDTDTVAFMAGTMAGLYYKIEAIPQEWIKNLVEVEMIEGKCKEFCRFLAENEYKSKIVQ